MTARLRAHLAGYDFENGTGNTEYFDQGTDLKRGITSVIGMVVTGDYTMMTLPLLHVITTGWPLVSFLNILTVTASRDAPHIELKLAD
jgi:hypothetical protein